MAGGTRGARTPLGFLRTMASILRLNLASIVARNSGLMRVLAKPYALCLSLARWHSITVEVRMGTWCLGNLLMFRATRTRSRAARRWSPPLAWRLTIR